MDVICKTRVGVEKVGSSRHTKWGRYKEGYIVRQLSLGFSLECLRFRADERYGILAMAEKLITRSDGGYMESLSAVLARIKKLSWRLKFRKGSFLPDHNLIRLCLTLEEDGCPEWCYLLDAQTEVHLPSFLC